MTQAVGDLPLFFKHINGQLAGLAGTYVDDSMLSGSDEFMKSTDVTSQRFEAKPKALDNFVFAGLEISTTDRGLASSAQANRQAYHATSRCAVL
ncbi:hypothetical protein BWQ96_10370 [Gracilariopsis chorda]|uniref:Uncharacterized protein n=1 Tax=Gracilariopsis chorda TaxID=448386 RepID=A0A2V3ICU4_9FLOR|nr:hypothetical protein BWQ96_10370 [Gracilariopsis chorda]|eukprot:PXF39897.1 hypothetical protein BWQ96_10370 [Gracilariopsis chorda]